MTALQNRILDRAACPEIQLGRRTASAFHVCGLTGLALALGLATTLTVHLGLSLWVLAAMAGTAVLTFLALAMVTKIVLGEEQLIYYHHEVAILTTVTLVLVLLGEPVLRYLDVTILGVGTFLFCGRVGCFMVGCCHGRPHRWGVRYRPEHADAGFTRYYVGIRLFPIQLIESCWVFATVVVGVGLVVGGAAPGAALAWYVIVYDVGRFGFEFVRGDPARPYRGGFSEGQWTSLLLMLVVVGAELAGAVPAHVWHVVATAGVVLVMITVAARRRVRRDTRHRLTNPNHIAELDTALERLSLPRQHDGTSIDVLTTSAGLRVSTDLTHTGHGVLRHYTLSTKDGRIDEPGAHALASSIVLLRHHDAEGELLAGDTGVFHLVIPPREPLDSYRRTATP